LLYLFYYVQINTGRIILFSCSCMNTKCRRPACSIYANSTALYYLYPPRLNHYANGNPSHQQRPYNIDASSTFFIKHSRHRNLQFWLWASIFKSNRQSYNFVFFFSIRIVSVPHPKNRKKNRFPISHIPAACVSFYHLTHAFALTISHSKDSTLVHTKPSKKVATPASEPKIYCFLFLIFYLSS
jgi:hypothetical protein